MAKSGRRPPRGKTMALFHQRDLLVPACTYVCRVGKIAICLLAVSVHGMTAFLGGGGNIMEGDAKS